MTTVEDRTRAAMDAITGLVEGAPPLPLPPPPETASRRRGRVPSLRRRWDSWLAPAAAAVAVLATAISLVVVRDMPAGRPAPAASPVPPATAVPRYYVTFGQPRGDTTTPVGLVLGETLTGKKLFTLRPPRGLSFAGITAAADDRTFVADAHRDPYGVQGSQARSRTWYVVRVAGTGARASLTMTRLPIPPTPVGTVVAAIALSPDGTMLAVATMPYTDDVRHAKQVLRVYSVATGAVLHSWSTAFGQLPLGGGAGGSGGDPNTELAWIGDRALAFNGGTRAASGTVTLEVRVLDLSRPDGDLLASSRAAVILPPEDWEKPSPFGCAWFWGDVMITGDGKSYVCGGTGTSGARLPQLPCGKGPAWNTVAFATFSLTTGKLIRFPAGYRTACHGYNVAAYPLWANTTGTVEIGYMFFAYRNTGRFGVFSHGSFRPLPIPVPGSSYQYLDGSLLNQVAW